MWAAEGYVKEIKGDLLTADVKIRGHQVNCRGVMGAGIAKQVREKYPEAFEQYKALCDQFGSSLLGHTQFVTCHDGTIIANMFAQDGFGPGLQTNMTALDECLSQVATLAYRVNASVGFPKLLGCGLAGGDWDEVTKLIGNYFDFKGGGCTIVEWDPPKPGTPAPETGPEIGKKATVTIYTDGSCIGNPGPGGWAAILMAENSKGKQTREMSGGEADTTNNRMELMAVINALSSLKKPCHGKLYSDSSYVVNSITKGWMAGWKKAGWHKKGGLANADLWKQLDELLQKHDIMFIWVKGHADNPFNNRCDEMAQAEARKLLSDQTRL